jgi:hypothetical protein
MDPARQHLALNRLKDETLRLCAPGAAPAAPAAITRPPGRRRRSGLWHGGGPGEAMWRGCRGSGLVHVVGWLAAVALVDCGENKYCNSELGKYDQKCADRHRSAGAKGRGSAGGGAWADGRGGGPLRWAWGTPIYSDQLQLTEADREELVRLITSGYFNMEDHLTRNGQLPPAEVNDEFYAWQQDRDGAWMQQREDCLRRHQLSLDGPPPGGESPQYRQTRQSCEEQAEREHWPELRTSGAYKRLYEELSSLCQAYLRELNLHGREERGTFEFDADGDELIWTWASVHYDGIEHLVHDHPASLLSGTLYLQVPQDAGWLKLHDPRESRKGTPIYNVDLLFEHWPGLVADGSTGMTELLKLSVLIVLVHFDLAVLTFIFSRCGCARLRELMVVSSLVVTTSSMLCIGFLLWLMSSTEFDDDIDYPFAGNYGIEPTNGRIVIFPGWLLHQVEPSNVASETPRVALSFNIRGTWTPTGSALSADTL